MSKLAIILTAAGILMTVSGLQAADGMVNALAQPARQGLKMAQLASDDDCPPDDKPPEE